MNANAERFRVRGAEFDSFDEAALQASVFSAEANAAAVWVEWWEDGRWQPFCKVESGGSIWAMMLEDFRATSLAV